MMLALSHEQLVSAISNDSKATCTTSAQGQPCVTHSYCGILINHIAKQLQHGATCDKQTTPSSLGIAATQTMTSHGTAASHQTLPQANWLSACNATSVPADHNERTSNSPVSSWATRYSALGLDLPEPPITEPNNDQDIKIRNGPALHDDSTQLPLILQDACDTIEWLCYKALPPSNSHLEPHSSKGWPVQILSSVTEPQNFPETISFTNSISMSKDNMHIQLTADQLGQSFIASLEKKNKAVKIKILQTKIHIGILANVLIENLTFKSQIKEQLTIQAGTFGNKPDLRESFLKSVAKSGIREHISNWTKIQHQQLIKSDHRKPQRPLGMAVLNNTGGRHLKDHTLKQLRPNARQTSAQQIFEARTIYHLLNALSRFHQPSTRPPSHRLPYYQWILDSSPSSLSYLYNSLWRLHVNGGAKLVSVAIGFCLCIALEYSSSTEVRNGYDEWMWYASWSVVLRHFDLCNIRCRSNITSSQERELLW